MKTHSHYKFILFTLLFISQIGFSFAGVMAEASRLIFPEGVTERSLMIANTNNYPILVQTWVDNGDVNNTPEKTLSPFIVLPAVFQMAPKEVKGLRVLFKEQTLPTDRETVFWLNLYEIPAIRKSSMKDDAKVIVAMNTQMKIFYRPKILLKKPDDIGNRLQFSLKKQESSFILHAHNPTAYYVSFSNITLNMNNKQYTPSPKLDMMLAPLSSDQFIFKDISTTTQQQNISLKFTLIDDAGLPQEGYRKNIFSNK